MSNLKKDSQRTVIDLSDEPDLLIEQLVRFLYRGEYDDTFCKGAESPWGPKQFNLKMFIAADKYEIPDLACYAKHKFQDLLNKIGDAQQRQDFMRAVYDLYHEAPDSAAELRGKVIEAGVSASHVLFEDGLKTQQEPEQADLTFQQLVRDVPEFGDEVMLALSKFARKKTVFECPHCNCKFSVTSVRCDLQVHCPYCKKWARGIL